MKTFLISAAVLFASSHGFAALPPDVEQLIQTDKLKEALERVETLLREKPDDTELKEAQKELRRLVPVTSPASSAPAAPPPAPVSSPAKTKELPPEKAENLDRTLAHINRSEGEDRKRALKFMMEDTDILIRSYPDVVSLWAMRALAALELSQEYIAREAGANLLRLGADRTGNEQTLTLMAMLTRKGWLGGAMSSSTDIGMSTNTHGDSVSKGAGQDFLRASSGAIPGGIIEFTPPPQGYFGLSEIFSKGAYMSYNSHSQSGILKKAQEKFKEAGLYASKADGVPGPGTQKAILAYQNANHLTITGRLDDATVKVLGLAGLSQTSSPASSGGGTESSSGGGMSASSREAKQRELASLQAQQNSFFSRSQNYDGMARNQRALGRDDSWEKGYANRLFNAAQALNGRIEALKKALRQK